MERMLSSGFEEVFNHLDPYSRYVTPAEARGARERRVGQSGLGLRVERRGESLVIAAVTPGGPAALSGIRARRRSAGGGRAALAGRDLGLAATLLEGPEGSAVSLTLSRAGRRREAVLVRELIVPRRSSPKPATGCC
jgi:carboxyl-terminal processing protease